MWRTKSVRGRKNFTFFRNLPEFGGGCYAVLRGRKMAIGLPVSHDAITVADRNYSTRNCFVFLIQLFSLRLIHTFFRDEGTLFSDICKARFILSAEYANFRHGQYPIQAGEDDKRDRKIRKDLTAYAHPGEGRHCQE